MRAVARVGLGLAMLLGAACDEGAGPHELATPGMGLGSLANDFGAGVDVAILPVLSSGVALGEACVGVRVADETGHTLGADEALCGPVGDLSYVGACDATKPTHTVTVWLQELSDMADQPLAAGAWANPCAGDTESADPTGWYGGCQMTFDCRTGASASVVFNLFVDPASEPTDQHRGCGD